MTMAKLDVIGCNTPFRTLPDKVEMIAPIESLGGHFKTGHRGSLQNRPTELSSWTNLFYPIGHPFGKPNLIQSGFLAGPDSSLLLPSPEGELGNPKHPFLLG